MNQRLHAPIWFVIHHTAANDHGTHINDLIAERKRRNEGYNVIIDDEDAPANGKARVVQDVPDEEISNGVYMLNADSLNFSVNGNFEVSEPTADELEALVQALATKAKKFGKTKEWALGNAAKGLPSHIITHQEAGMKYAHERYVTACPGKNLIKRMDWIRQRVASYLPA